MVKRLMGLSVPEGNYKGSKKDFYNDVLMGLANIYDKNRDGLFKASDLMFDGMLAGRY